MPAPVVAGAVRAAAVGRMRAPSATTPFAGAPSFKEIFAPDWPVKVGTGPLIGVLFVAILADAAQMFFTLMHVLPLIGTAFALTSTFIVGVCAYVFIVVIFAACQVQFVSGKRMAAKVASLLGPIVGEMAPFLSALPLLTTGTVMTFIYSRMDDRDRAMEKARKADAQALDAMYMDQQKARIIAQQRALQEEAEVVDETVSEEYLDLRTGENAETEAIPKKSRLPAPGLPYKLDIPKAAPPPSKRSDISPSGWR